MDWTLEVVIVPVSDLGAAIAFYRDQVGFDLDHETQNEHMHVAQLTPRGLRAARSSSATCPRRTRWRPGSLHGVQLVVADAEAARDGAGRPGRRVLRDPGHRQRDGGTFFGFTDPDGNSWAVQQLKVRGETPLIPHEHRGRFGEGVET